MIRILYAVLLSALFVARCTMDSDTIAGSKGGSETTNGVTASVVLPDGRPAAGVRVRLRSSDYTVSVIDPGRRANAAIDTVTDSSGTFFIDSIEPGSYRIEVSDLDSSAILFELSLSGNDTVDLGVGTLTPFAVVDGRVDTTGAGGVQYYAQVVGLERLIPVAASGHFRIDDLPAGTHTVCIVTTSDTMASATTSVSLAAGETERIPLLPGWRYHTLLTVNPAAAGGAIIDTITGHPLLVRLDITTFDFTQATSDGQDVRFVKPDGTMLPLEIEYWNAAGEKAALWIRLDTLYSGSAPQLLHMFWGNESVQFAAHGRAVFDTALGYRGVWHMGATGRDATPLRNDGVVQGARDTVGVIGRASAFDGIDDIVDIGDPVDGSLDFGYKSFSFSVWVYVTNTMTTTDILWYKGGQDTTEAGYTLGLGSGMWKGKVADGTSKISIDFGSVTDFAGEWTYLAAVVDREASMFRLYANGLPADSADISALGSLSSNYDAAIEGPGRLLNGLVDEVRMQTGALSPEEVRIIYENLKPGSAFAAFP
jgi:hypothetical protein